METRAAGGCQATTSRRYVLCTCGMKDSQGVQIDHELLAQEDKDDSENPLGALEKAVLEVNGLRVQPRPSTAQQRLIFRIKNEKTDEHLDVGAESEEDMKEWAKCITDAALACEQA